MERIDCRGIWYKKMGGEVIDLGNPPSMEEIIASQPDVIFLIYKSNSDIYVKNEFMQNRIYNSLPAVKDRRVYLLPLTFSYNSGVKTLDALKVMERNF